MDVVLVRTIGRGRLAKATIRDLENLTPPSRRARQQKDTPCPGGQQIGGELWLDPKPHVGSERLPLKDQPLEDL